MSAAQVGQNAQPQVAGLGQILECKHANAHPYVNIIFVRWMAAPGMRSAENKPSRAALGAAAQDSLGPKTQDDKPNKCNTCACAPGAADTKHIDPSVLVC